MQTNWDEKCIKQVGYFSHVNPERLYSGKSFNLGELHHLMRIALRILKKT